MDIHVRRTAMKLRRSEGYCALISRSTMQLCLVNISDMNVQAIQEWQPWTELQ